MNNILCPIDFSDASINALEFAVKIAEVHSSTVKLLHVLTEEEYAGELKFKDSNAFENFEDKYEQKLKKITEEINKDQKTNYELSSYEIVNGDLVSRINEFIEKFKISMVAMGTSGVGDIREARVGSNTAKVIESTNVPVLSVPKTASYSVISNIIYGSEFEEEDRSYLQPILNFATAFDSRIYVVHITSENNAIDSTKYSEYIDDVRSYFVYEKLSFEQFITDMDKAIALEHVLNEHNADLLILVHKSRNFPDSLFHKSLTKRMSYMTNFPLLVLRN